MWSKLYNGDCLELMQQIPDESIDMVLCDLPYGTTHCKWDSVLDLDKLWEQYKRIIKSDGAIVLNSQQPFSSKLVMSNIDWFKYSWVWKKNRCPNFMMAKYVPLKTTEDILVFSAGGVNQNTKNKMRYYPQGVEKCEKHIDSNVKKQGVNIYNCLNKTYTQTTTGYPTNIIEFACESGLHPTQKPVALAEYIIKTYTNENDVVLDNCMGSGTTGLACKKLNRNFIGIELDEKYFNIAKDRIDGVLL